jgi:hypothetical protein
MPETNTPHYNNTPRPFLSNLFPSDTVRCYWDCTHHCTVHIIVLLSPAVNFTSVLDNFKAACRTLVYMPCNIYRGADKSLAQPTSQCILLDGENISFDDGFGGLVVSILATGTRPKPLDFFGHPKNPPYAFLRKGSKICPMSQLCGMLKNPTVFRELRL